LAPRDRIDIGVAFLAMGLNDLALRQFSQITRDQGAVYVDSQHLSACALLASGRAFEAILRAEPMLADSEIPESQKMHFVYLLGRAYEVTGNREIAARFYREVARIDPEYRDVAERLR
jgi:tetratricopeptide (TPR) repeat protein